jgi:tetratricopeptide (TPR) repeat protein
VDDPHHTGEVLLDLGTLLQALGQAEEAVAHHESALEIYRALGDRYFEAIALSRLAPAMSALGRTTEAIALQRQARDLFHQFSDLDREAEVLTALAGMLQEAGMAEQAEQARSEATQRRAEHHDG